MSSIGSVLRLRREKIDRKKVRFVDLQPITIHFNGMVDKRTVDEGREYTMDLFTAKPGDIVVAKIDLKNGAVGIVPDGWTNVAVTGHFAVYEPDRAKLVPDYLRLLVQAEFFKEHLWRNKVGAEGRKEVKLDFLEAELIPLPPLAIQRNIVAAWEAACESAAATAAKIEELQDDIETAFLSDLGLRAPKRTALPKAFAVNRREIERWSVLFNQLAATCTEPSVGKYPVAELGEVAKVSYGIQKCPANRPGQYSRPYLRVANVQRGELDLREVRYIDVPDKEMPSLQLEPGDLLVCEGNSAELVGRPALWRGEILGCVHQNHILKVRVDRAQVMPEYLLEYMNSAPARDHFRARAKFTTNLASINSNDLRELRVALPPLGAQREIVDEIAERRAEIAGLQREARDRASCAKAEVEAMLLGTKDVE